MIDFVYDELVRIGFVENRSQFSKEWLGKQESYYRGLRNKNRQPSMHVLVSCACRLQGTGDSLLVYGDDQLRAKGRRLKRLARRCFAEITSSDKIAQYAAV